MHRKTYSCVVIEELECGHLFVAEPGKGNRRRKRRRCVECAVDADLATLNDRWAKIRELLVATAYAFAKHFEKEDLRTGDGQRIAS